MSKLSVSETLMVSFDKSDSEDLSYLQVIKYKGAETRVINVLVGAGAEDVYDKLVGGTQV